MRKILTLDTTLRDGEQTPRVSLSPQMKLKIAEEIAALGVDIIEIGFPGASPNDFFSAELIAEKVKSATLCGFARSFEVDIVAASKALSKAKKPMIQIVTSVSDLHIKEKLNLDRERTLKLIESSIKLARNYFSEVTWIAEDASRTERDFLLESFKVALDSGATILTYADTCGFAYPTLIDSHIKTLLNNLEWKNSILGIHCHNDLGMAVANTLTGLLAGAGQFQGTINGIGERAGNASLEEITMAIKIHSKQFGMYTDIDTTSFRRVAELVSQATNIPIPVNKPIVGANAFAHSSGIHQDGVLKNAKTYEIMNPEDVGFASNSIIIDRHSGKRGIMYKLKQNGIEVSDEQFSVILEKVKNELSGVGNVSDEDFLKIARSAVKERD